MFEISFCTILQFFIFQPSTVQLPRLHIINNLRSKGGNIFQVELLLSRKDPPPPYGPKSVKKSHANPIIPPKIHKICEINTKFGNSKSRLYNSELLFMGIIKLVAYQKSKIDEFMEILVENHLFYMRFRPKT